MGACGCNRRVQDRKAKRRTASCEPVDRREGKEHEQEQEEEGSPEELYDAKILVEYHNKYRRKDTLSNKMWSLVEPSRKSEEEDIQSTKNYMTRQQEAKPPLIVASSMSIRCGKKPPQSPRRQRQKSTKSPLCQGNGTSSAKSPKDSVTDFTNRADKYQKEREERSGGRKEKKRRVTRPEAWDVLVGEILPRKEQSNESLEQTPSRLIKRREKSSHVNLIKGGK